MSYISASDLFVEVDPMLLPFFDKAVTKFQEDCQNIQKLIPKSDFEGIRIIAHNLKGEGGSYGIEKVSELGKKIELAAKNQRLELIEQMSKDLFYLLTYIKAI